MDFTLKIQGKESGKIEIGEKYVKGVDYIYDTVGEDLLDKSSDIVVKLNIQGELNNDVKSQTKEIAKWALMTKGADVYRDVTIIIEDNDNIIREYNLNEAFVVDYFEKTTYKKGENSKSDKMVWELIVAQKGDRLEGVKVKD